MKTGMSETIDREENLIAYIKDCFEKTLNDVITHFVCAVDELQPANISSLLECLYDTEEFRAFSDDVDAQYVSFVRDVFEKIWGGF